MSDLEIAIKAIQLYAEMKPRPLHVNQVQAAEMLGVSRQTIARMLRTGELSYNKFGLIPITEIDAALKPRKAS
ncbi:DNA binding domain-containing protein, excisionase family [Methylobacillus rhizosphaerae]|uniref:DNA binding domain-containing protein, excisionase family n=1 Tax=Methylobacillus rhizosphaerae TaxID=551994 RepID=A0A239AV39_9PROT|nr:DNA binding domain-containing protein, excisionase family [Methylobacillus rhizosphaerae]